MEAPYRLIPGGVAAMFRDKKRVEQPPRRWREAERLSQKGGKGGWSEGTVSGGDKWGSCLYRNKPRREKKTVIKSTKHNSLSTKKKWANTPRKRRDQTARSE